MKNRYLVYVWIVACVLLTACTSQNNNKNTGWHELYRINVGGKYGFINEKGNIIIEPQYDDANFFFADSLCYAVIADRRGLINPDGNFVVDLNNNINWVYRYKNSSAICSSSKGKYGIIGKNGTILLPAIYKKIERDGNFGYIVEDTLKNMGYVDNNGEVIVPCQYDAVNGYHEGLMVVATRNKCGYVDVLGNWSLDTIYDDARGFSEGYARVVKDGEWSFIDHNGNIVEFLKYDEILSGLANNRAFVKSGSSILLIDKSGNIIKKIEADSVFSFSDGFATFKQNGKYGKIDTLGNVVIPAKFNILKDFEYGYARFELNGKYGVIDTTCTIIINAAHNYGTGIIKGYSLLYGQDSIHGNYPITYYDKFGNEIWKDMCGNQFNWPKSPTKNDYIAYFDSKLSELDPIEGVYYVTFNNLAVDRDNGHSSSNGSSSKFYAVIRQPNSDEFIAWNIDDKTPWRRWVKMFVQIGESNAYAVVNSGDNTNWAEDGKLILEDPHNFEVTLRTGGNNYYNWYVKCEFIKDYPTASVYEQVQQAEWSGSGFAIANEYLVTNYHVITGAKSINIKGVGGDINKKYKGYVVASDKQHDLAIIRIVDKDFKGFGNIPYCLGKSVPEVGDNIFVLGYPMTSTMGKEIKLTDGIISAASGYKGDQSMYQISAAVQPGNSGGPLFDNDGNVIGIICAKHADAENANYAIKVSYLYSLIKSSGIGIKLSDNNKVKSESLSKKVRLIQSYVYLIECSSH